MGIDSNGIARFGPYNTLDSDPNIQLNGVDGSAEFAGGITEIRNDGRISITASNGLTAISNLQMSCDRKDNADFGKFVVNRYRVNPFLF